jgi:uncharacterized protein (DUF2164 family)
MTKVKRSWDILSEEQRKLAINEIIDYFVNERGEQIGIIAAEGLLDMFLQTLGPDLYNKGVEDSKKFIKDYLEEIDIEIDIALKKDSFR